MEQDSAHWPYGHPASYVAIWIEHNGDETYAVPLLAYCSASSPFDHTALQPFSWGVVDACLIGDSRNVHMIDAPSSVPHVHWDPRRVCFVEVELTLPSVAKACYNKVSV